ncbi:protein AMN1 homolog isoform X3 [Pristis pectinata]|uniref:protein AMN1 homolog isoform X3 n=1 Tax=Pristis pectinata TaxID=685728 RepID=UPI00223E3267|nr:protein AMN1 homolog isoform X3 [Pristis pectinata]
MPRAAPVSQSARRGSGRGMGPSLLDLCLCSLVKLLPRYATDVQSLPPNLKDKLIKIMSLQGIITDENMSQVLHPGLQKLDLRDCDITDHGLIMLQICTQLREINLSSSDCKLSITSEGLKAIASSCPHLSEVCLRRCQNVSDEGIVALAQQCRLLQIINISGCLGVTDASLQALGKNCKFLHSVDFSATKNQRMLIVKGYMQTMPVEGGCCLGKCIKFLMLVLLGW